MGFAKRVRIIPEDTSSGAVGALVIASVLALSIGMPYLVWVAMRDNGRSRLDAWLTIAVAYALALIPLAWSPPGGLIWMAGVWFLEGAIAVVHIAIRASRDRRAEEEARLYS